MYIYISSADSLDAYPHNTPQHFTAELSQTLYTKSQGIGLREISLHPITTSENVHIDSVDETDKTTPLHTNNVKNEVYMYVMVAQCSNVDVHGHRHPVVRMLTSSDFTHNSSILRFPDVLYVPLKEYNISQITVSIRPVNIENSSCCVENKNLLTGITRCTFHIQDL
jgi:hypothetical protein